MLGGADVFVVWSDTDSCRLPIAGRESIRVWRDCDAHTGAGDPNASGNSNGDATPDAHTDRDTDAYANASAANADTGYAAGAGHIYTWNGTVHRSASA